MRAIRNGVLLCCLFVIFPSVGFPAECHEIAFERDVEVRMRDGVLLRADIYRPKAAGKFPVLLLRTPYDKQGERDMGMTFAARGYVAILQDVRGRFASMGEWYPFKYESTDGYDTIAWAATLPYADGKVGMFGGSYEGATQLLAAISHPPHLAGIFPEVTASNYHEGWVYQGGAFEQWMNESWTANLARDTLNRRVRENTKPLSSIEKLPLSSFLVQGTVPQAQLAPYFFDWLEHPAYDEFWKALSIDEHYSEIAVPVFHTGAWYDIFLGGTLRNYMELKSHADGEDARRGQRLMIGVGGHAGAGPKVGEVDFGPNSEPGATELLLRWYDHLLKNVANGSDQDKPVKIFVMGRNQWRDENEWPLARARTTSYYLQSDSSATSAKGGGRLTPELGGNRLESDKFTYDPANPVPTHGGPLCCARNLQPAGPMDQTPVEARNDVLVYATPVFQDDFEVTGPVGLELYVSSSAVDTDFTAKLVDVWPNGFAQNLNEGILRMRYRSSREHPEMISPGKIYKITIDMTATSNVFLAGHKLRLEISSSNFPRFDRNLNTGEEQSQATRMVKVQNTVWHDKEHPSALILPVVPR